MQLTDISDEDLDRAEDLKELMAHWFQQEMIVFSRDPGHGAPSQGAQWLSAGARARVVHKLRHLVLQHDAAGELSTALTLFDAVGSKLVARCSDADEQIAGSTTPSVQGRVLALSSIASPPVLAALAYITLKCSASVSELQQATLSLGLATNALETLADGQADEIEKVLQCPSLLTIAEVEVVAQMEGRTGLVSPPEWACSILDRLSVTSTAPVRQAIEQASPGVTNWARLLTERITATPDCPPRALALGACVLGLCAAGVLDLDEVRPKTASDEVWKESLLARMKRQSHTPGPEAQIPACRLAEASDVCDVNVLRQTVFEVVGALQESLYEEVPTM
jgi:hypothetical protein